MQRQSFLSHVIQHPCRALLGVGALFLVAGLLFGATRGAKEDSAEPNDAAPIVGSLPSETSPPVPESATTVQPTLVAPVPMPATRQTYRDLRGRFQIDYPADYFYYNTSIEGATYDERVRVFDPTQPVDGIGFVSERLRKDEGGGFSYISIGVDLTDYQTDPIMVYLKSNGPCPGQLLTFPNIPQPVCYQEDLTALVPQTYAWSDGSHTYWLSVIAGIPPETIHWMMWSFRSLPERDL